MPRESNPRAGPREPLTYQVRITGRLGPDWADWFEGLAITVNGGDTLITGRVVDQATLHGLIRKVRDLGLPLVSVTPIDVKECED